jgi:hypothetical protein
MTTTWSQSASNRGNSSAVHRCRWSVKNLRGLCTRYLTRCGRRVGSRRNLSRRRGTYCRDRSLDPTRARRICRTRTQTLGVGTWKRRSRSSREGPTTFSRHVVAGCRSAWLDGDGRCRRISHHPCAFPVVPTTKKAHRGLAPTGPSPGSPGCAAAGGCRTDSPACLLRRCIRRP